MKLIKFTLAHAILIFVKVLESFLFTSCMPMMYRFAIQKFED